MCQTITKDLHNQFFHGVNKILSLYDTVIVIEDDLIFKSIFSKLY